MQGRPGAQRQQQAGGGRQSAARPRSAPASGIIGSGGGSGVWATPPPDEQRGRSGGCWAAEAEVEVTSPMAPPGYRLVGEAERLETLGNLQSKLRELDHRYSNLPLRIETEGQIRSQRQLRDKIKETEDAVSLFSRAKVLLEA